MRGFGSIEVGGYLVGEREEGSGSGAGGSETVLGFRNWKVVGELGEEESFEDFGCGTEEGDGAVGGGQVTGFVGFGDGDDVGMLPYGWYGSAVEGVVEQVGKVLDAPRAQMLQVPNCKAIWAFGRRVSTPLDCFRNKFGGEGVSLGG